MSEVASAYVSLLPSGKGFGPAMSRQLGPELDKAGKTGGKRYGSAFGGAAKSLIAPALGVVSLAGASSFLKGALAEARESQKVGAQTRAVIKSTGGAAKVTAKQFGQLATAESNKVGIDDEAIQAGENMLATFTNVRNEVGKNNDIFNQATKLAVDLGVATKSGPVEASLLLGKALNDPAKGMTRLQRVGVTFTAQQKAQAAQMVKVGDTAGAQKVILKELAKEFGGSAEAQATEGEKARVAYDNLRETIGTALLPVLDKFEHKLTSDVIPGMSRFVTQMQNGTGEGGRVAKQLGQVVDVGQDVAGVVIKIATTFDHFPVSTQKVLLLAGAALFLKNRFGDSVPTIQSFNRETATAAAKGVALRSAALGAGLGLSALASKAGGTQTALGQLATFGAAVATGFAVGGPWGAAIGGGAGALAIFKAESAKAANEQHRLDGNAASVAATLNAQTGALTKNTRATAAKALADDGAFAAANRMGIPLKDVLDASLGNAAALKRVTAASESWANSLAKSGHYTEKQEGDLQLLRNSIGSTNTQIDKQRAKIDLVNKALTGYSGRLVSAKVSLNTSSFSASLKYVIASMNKIGKLSQSAKVSLHASGVGSNATGTNDWRGGWTTVGEKGTELLKLPRHTEIIPHNKIGSFSDSPPLGTAGSRDNWTRSDIEALIAAVEAGREVQVDGRTFAKEVQRANGTGKRL